MDSRIPSSPKVDSGNFESQPSNDPKVCRRKAGRKQSQEEPPKNLGNILIKIVRHLFPKLSNLFKSLPEHRREDKLYYRSSHLIWCGILIFLLHLGSRRQFRFERKSALFLQNLLRLSQTKEESIADPDTLADYLEKLPSSHLENIQTSLIKDLIRKKVLNPYRLDEFFLIAIDGTGQLVYKERHCPHCLTKKTRDGQLIYYHPVLEGKLVTHNGQAFSVVTEFIENPNEFHDKQDCELKAFKRLAVKLKEKFERTPLCILGDAIYANQSFFATCKKNGWKFFVTFKEGSMPATYQEALQLIALAPENKKEIHKEKLDQSFSWVNGLLYENFSLNLLFCNEKKPDQTLFAWITNFDITFSNVQTLANRGGRLRWKIENEGFNIQKNGGYALEHAFSENPNAAKNFYFLLQMAHTLNQLMAKSTLLDPFEKILGSLKNFAKRLSESLRNVLIDPFVLLIPFQFRFCFNTS